MVALVPISTQRRTHCQNFLLQKNRQIARSFSYRHFLEEVSELTEELPSWRSWCQIELQWQGSPSMEKEPPRVIHCKGPTPIYSAPNLCLRRTHPPPPSCSWSRARWASSPQFWPHHSNCTFEIPNRCMPFHKLIITQIIKMFEHDSLWSRNRRNSRVHDDYVGSFAEFLEVGNLQRHKISLDFLGAPHLPFDLARELLQAARMKGETIACTFWCFWCEECRQ